MFSYVRNFGHPLACYLFSESKVLQEQIIQAIPFGGATINDVAIHLANNHMGFGGFGDSGMGAYHGKQGIRLFHPLQINTKKIYQNRNPSSCSPVYQSEKHYFETNDAINTAHIEPQDVPEKRVGAMPTLFHVNEPKSSNTFQFKSLLPDNEILAESRNNRQSLPEDQIEQVLRNSRSTNYTHKRSFVIHNWKLLELLL